jgi:hypothetical protein
MAAFDRTVELAKRQLPRAFTIGGGLPYSGGGDPRRLPERLDNLEEGAFANAVGSTIPAGTEEAGTEDVRNLEGSFTESFTFPSTSRRQTACGEFSILIIVFGNSPK